MFTLVGNKQTGVSGVVEQCRHHWILRKRCEGRCMACKKKFEKDRFNFSSSSDTKQAYRSVWIRLQTDSSTPRRHWLTLSQPITGRTEWVLSVWKPVIQFVKRAISCSWCKENYHYSDQCFNVENKLKEPCTMGEHSKLIVPPYWIVKTR